MTENFNFDHEYRSYLSDPRLFLPSGHDHRKTMLAVADRIELHPESYVQGRYGFSTPECGTVACIAGWGALIGFPGAMFVEHSLFLPRPDGPPVWVSADDAGKVALGLTDRQADLLFAGGTRPKDPTMTVPEVLRELAEHPDRVDMLWE